VSIKVCLGNYYEIGLTLASLAYVKDAFDIQGHSTKPEDGDISKIE
jgi:hypothetical protein